VSKIILILYILTTSIGLIVLKLGTNSGLPITLVENKIQFNINAATVIGIILYGLSFIMYMYLISKNDLGYIIPLAASFVYILIFFGSYLVFNEVFTPTKIIGISLILGGMIFINLNK